MVSSSKKKRGKVRIFFPAIMITIITTQIFTGCAGKNQAGTKSSTKYAYSTAVEDKTEYIVAKDGSGDFKTIKEAIAKVNTGVKKRVKIFIKNGTYDEDQITIPEDKINITMIGESRDSVLITRDAGLSGTDTVNVTLEVKGGGFVAENLTFENRVPYSNAVKSSADRVIFKNCVLVGGQDTLYLSADNTRSYFENCIIKGYTDFIYGPGTAIFNKCDIITHRRGGCITAASTNPANKYGLIFMNCNIKSEFPEYKTALGRPWRQGAAVVFMNCFLGEHVSEKAWTDMGDSKAELARFFEYKNTGPGAIVNEQRKQLTDEEAKEYTFENIYKNRIDTWDPFKVQY